MSKIGLDEQASAPATPDSGKTIIYVKTDGNLYQKDDAGTETNLTAGGGATIELDNLGTTALNADLLFDTDDTYDIGSTTKRIAHIWAEKINASQEIECYNDSGSEITTEQLVYVSGYDNGTDLPEISLSDHDAAGAAHTIGITQAAIANGASGHILILGVATYPTTGMGVGDALYVSDTAGSATNTRPTTGHIMRVGDVIKVGASGIGRILISMTGAVQIDDPVNVSSANVSNPPTDAELDSEYGTPASVGNGFISLLDDNAADINVYLVASNGTSWWYTALTKAT